MREWGNKNKRSVFWLSKIYHPRKWSHQYTYNSQIEFRSLCIHISNIITLYIRLLRKSIFVNLYSTIFDCYDVNVTKLYLYCDNKSYNRKLYICNNKIHRGTNNNRISWFIFFYFIQYNTPAGSQKKRFPNLTPPPHHYYFTISFPQPIHWAKQTCNDGIEARA